MAMLISGRSALRHIRNERSQRAFPPRTNLRAMPNRFSPPTVSQIDAAQKLLGCRNQPVHCIVSRREDRRKHPDVICHVKSSALARGSFFHHDAELCVSSPEAVFLQIHHSASDIEAIAVGFELCGTYIRVSDEHVIYGIPPVSSVVKIRSYLRRCQHERHAARALRNLDFVCEHSNSIRETALALYLSLPMSRGGAGLPKPILNKSIDVSKLTGVAWREDLRWTDIGWPGLNIGVEYDSDEFHSNPEKLTQDARRRTLLQAAGCEVIVVTNDQFRCISELDKVVKAIYRGMGKYQRCRARGFRLKQAALHKELLRLGR